MEYDYFKYDLKGQSGGVLITDIIDDEQFVILGKSNIPKRADCFEGFGGKVEKCDISSLHTALRELIEEFFNLKIPLENINEIANIIRKNKMIDRQYNFYGMSYVINFKTLNYIFLYLCEIENSLQVYNMNNIFDMQTYIENRIINDKADGGLNEIQSLHLFKLSDIKEKKIKLRWFTDKIINKLFR